MNFSRLRYLLAYAVVALACALPLRAQANIDYTDMWWNPAESGWGVNLVQGNNVIFATFFIYDQNGAPVWYTGILNRGANDVFTGTVYAVPAGTWFGAPVFSPNPANTVAGDATFTPASQYRGTLRYRIGTVTVTKTIERQTLDTPSVDDVFIGGIAGTRSGGCPPPSFVNKMQFGVVQTASNNIRIEFIGADSTNLGALVCVMQGDATQYGKVFFVPNGTYQCVGGVSTSVEISSLRALDDGIEFHWRSDLGGGCIESGRAAGVKQ